ncbi:hypothetical protein TNCV_1032031 [Trichonephila clavipes]|nr:hypothetical protein TNCV_1032031 [Trichonephila clavipes]
MVTDSWSVCHKLEPSATVDPLVQESILVKSLKAQSPHIGMVWKLGERSQLSCLDFMGDVWADIVMKIQYMSLVALLENVYTNCSKTSYLNGAVHKRLYLSIDVHIELTSCNEKPYYCTLFLSGRIHPYMA